MREGNGTMLKYSDTSMFWITNRVAQFAYLRYNSVGKCVRDHVDAWELAMIDEVNNFDKELAGLSEKRARKMATAFSVDKAQQLFNKWEELDKYLMVKYIDGNIKGEENGQFVDNGNGKDIPGIIEQPGYSERWKRAVAHDNGEVLKVVK